MSDAASPADCVVKAEGEKLVTGKDSNAGLETGTWWRVWAGGKHLATIRTTFSRGSRRGEGAERSHGGHSSAPDSMRFDVTQYRHPQR